MFTLFDWGFRLALVLPWVAIIVSALILLVPAKPKPVQTETTRAAA